ncbi:type I restriction endonuclease subunit R [Neopusillimonas maritima]|uniref:Restriction endonuclease subunit R n=1 Tax=Neopusillimonas maritima TaxID=2026239 RepID=A0ABX9MXJ5_9BURK|nr:type I restriction endonuclease [Neopusillimonas maritima]RII83258.1 restriction endonuclease subunit R [Neopusillimonas maritima]
MADSKEHQFQHDIVQALQTQGWLVGTSAGYDRTHALYTEDLLAFFQEAYPDRWEKLCKLNPQNPAKILVQKTVRELERQGTLEVLRHGFKIPGVKIDLCSFKPDHGMNPESLARYQANRLRVVPEVSYSPYAKEGRDGNYNPRLDLVLFVNGIPTATLELKSEFKQSVENAKRQYKYDRPIKDPVTRKEEPLLTFKRGALVHFAVSQFEVAMTTRLAGKDTFFLPFNRGTEDGGAGNPSPASDSDYATGYLWEQVFAPDAWLHALSRFLHLERVRVEAFDGTVSYKETMIFPRYHQLDVVNQLLSATRAEGAGQRYLVQHSAGSGKSNSIAWLAHQLASLYDAQGQKLFQSVIVVTDRTVLDSQLQNTIYQFDHAQGVVRPITRDMGNQSKSEQLAEALSEQTRIIIVTIQTFPALFDALDKYPKLAQGRYAVIADEAHSSQTGSSASKLKAILAGAVAESDEDGEISAEDMLDAAVTARSTTEKISYYAFTATPKARTIELFGRVPDPSQPASAENKPQAFHVYSMRQAIEEGFILDVLRNYTTYDTAWRIAHADGPDDEVDSKQARIRLARWVRLHPYNISQKVQVIVEHFRATVRHLLDGQAKAMVVTGSRQEAVRYQLAMRNYIQEQGYTDVHPLVAFSGSVLPDEAIPEEVSETSKLLNPGLNGREHAKAFATEDFNVMIVANKFQTGFDQPKLCAMYVDKKLQGVDCVQTLSRLNRTFPGKENTYILDFVNNPQEVLDSFLPYYNKAELADVSDPQIVYDIQRKLDDEQIYHWEEVAAFAQAFFDPKAQASALAYHCKPARDRFSKRYTHAVETEREARQLLDQVRQRNDKAGVQKAEVSLKEAGEAVDRLELFRKNLISFVRLYEFLSQIVPYEDRELEQLNVYARHLYPLLQTHRLSSEDLELNDLELTHYRLTKRAEQDMKLEESPDGDGLEPANAVGSGKPHDPEKKRLSEIIEALNELFGAQVTNEDQLHFAKGVADRVQRDSDVMAQISQHSPDQVMHGAFPKRVEDIVLDAMNDNQSMALEVLANDQKMRSFARTILTLLVQRL